MWNVWEDVKGVRTLIATTWSESMAWMLCKERNTMAQIARGIRYDYERAV